MKIVELFQLVAPPRKTLALCLVLMALNSGIVLLNPWLAGQLTAFLTTDSSPFFPSLGALLTVWIIVLICRSITGFGNGYVLGRTAETVLANLRARLYDHLLVLPTSFFDDQRRGNLLSILTSDSAIVSSFVTGTLIQLIPVFVTLSGALIMMSTIDPAITLVAVVLVPVYAVVIKMTGRKIRPLSRQWIDAYGQLVANVEEIMGMIPAVKSYTREARETQRFNEKNLELLSLTRRQQAILILMPHLTSLLAGLGLVLLIWLGYRAIDTGDLTTAGLVTLIAYAMVLNQPLGQLAGVYGQIQHARGASERIVEFLAHPGEPRDDHLPPLGIKDGTIELIGVRFAYPASRQPVLRGVNLTIKRGEPVVITGENGAGKSTLAHLLMRLIEPNEGSILIDGTPIDRVSLQSLRSSIGLVAQNTLLVNDSVSNNIAWGLPFCSSEMIEEAARKAKAHDFIARLPQGYDTTIGDQGVKLSGGQRQRLSLARVLLKDPHILVFDEATSMMDPEGEEAFMADCAELLSGRTVLFITHRPENITTGKKVLALRDGRLEQRPAAVRENRLTGG